MTYNNLDTTDEAIICCDKCRKKEETAGVYHGGFGKKLDVLKPKFPKKKKLPDMFITKNSNYKNINSSKVKKVKKSTK